MFNIGDFLVKFKQITPPDGIIRDVFSEIILQILNININKTDISLKNNTVYIKTNPFIKNKIFIHKKDILKEAEKQLGKKTPKNII
jgi:hypothetical protein